MDCNKIGALIRRLRAEKGMTQSELAAALNVSDRAVSKWERGAGCPDISLLSSLSAVFGVNIEKLLEGEMSPNRKDSGNLKRLRFYICPDCGNLLMCTGNPEIYCCSRRLAASQPQPANAAHALTIEHIDGELCVTLNHKMDKAGYISFIAYVANERALLVKLYPEGDALARFPEMRGGRFYVYCTEHGLFVQNQ